LDLLQKFKEYIQEKQLFTQKDHLLIAVSGGVDSVVLCHLCQAAGYTITMAHCNFSLRGDESVRDAIFVRELAEKMQCELYEKDFDTIAYSQANKVSIQVAARELRYSWFSELISLIQKKETSTKGSAFYIVTAHHLDDSIETAFMNFCKGTGIAGLRGILPKKGQLVRPLLFASKENLLDYATENDLQWVNDSSNDEIKYTRNYIRNHIIPSLEKVFPGIRNNLAENLQRFAETDQLYRQEISNHKKKLINFNEEGIQIPVLKLQKVEPLDTILYEIIKDFGFQFQQVKEVKKLLKSESGKYISSSTHRILRNRAWLHISPLQHQQSHLIIIEPDNRIIEFDSRRLEIAYIPISDHSMITDSHVAQLDFRQMRFPLTLRKWKQGDYFYPLGMQKKKKIARFLIDQKLSLQQKEDTWVIESDKRIIWVVGYRIDNRFKLQSSTEIVFQINLSSL